MTPIEIAMEFAKLGFFVFPLYRGRNSQKLKPYGWARNSVLDPEKADKAISASKDLSEIETWTKRVKSGYNAGIIGFGVLGIDCVILDLDVKGGKTGISEFAEMIKDHAIPKTPMITMTKSGGLHLFYRRPEKYKESQIKTLSGIKVGNQVYPSIDLRGDGGFVVGPDELVTDLKSVPIGKYGTIGLTSIEDLPEFPEAVMANWLRTQTNTDLDNIIGLSNESQDFKSLIRRGRIPDFVPKGARNESFFIFIGVLKSKGIPIDVTRNMCAELAKKVEDPNSLTDSVDIEAMLARAYTIIPDSPFDVAIDLINRGLFQVTGFKSKLHYVILEDNPYIMSRSLHDETTMKTLLLKYQRTLVNDKGKDVQVNPMNHIVKVIGDENRVDMIGFKPNAGEVFSLHDEPGSKRFLNSYRPILIQGSPSDLNEIVWDEFNYLISRLFGDEGSTEYDLGMDFVSWLVQNPGIKPSIAPFIMSVNRGVGKSLLFDVIVNILGTAKTGDRQARIVKLDEITGRFFDPSGCVINLIDEVQFPAHRNMRQESTNFWRHLKNLITAKTVSVEIKGGATYQCPNTAAVMMAGNFGSYFPIEEFDRRLWIIDNNPPPLSTGTVDHLFDMVNRSMTDSDDRNRYISTLRYKLMHRKIVNDLSIIRAPMTSIKQEMYENSLTDLEEWFVVHFKDTGNLFAFTPIVSQSSLEYVYEQSGRSVSDNPNMFRELKRRGYLRPVKLNKNPNISRQFTVPTIGLDGSQFKSEKREILYTTRDHGVFDHEETEKVLDLFRQNCATIARHKQQQISAKHSKITEEILLGTK